MLFYLQYRAKSQNFNSKFALDVGIFSTVLGFVGARLFHVFYEYPEFYKNNPLEIFKLWKGGYVFLGGVVTAVVSGVLFLKWKKQVLSTWLDLFAPVLALGYGIGRWACFFQGCCYGKETDSVFGVHFKLLAEAGESFSRWPTQLMTSFIEIVLFFIIIIFEKQKKINRKPGQLFYLWLVGHGLNRMLMETLRDDPRGPLLGQLGISFWISGIMSAVGLYFMLHKTRKVGV